MHIIEAAGTKHIPKVETFKVGGSKLFKRSNLLKGKGLRQFGDRLVFKGKGIKEIKGKVEEVSIQGKRGLTRILEALDLLD